MDRVELSVDAGSMHAVSRQRPQSPEGGLRSPPALINRPTSQSTHCVTRLQLFNRSRFAHDSV
jgi:hypothetical protein